MASKTTLDGELMFPSEYVAAVELKGRDVTLTIAHIEKAELQLRNGGKKVKPVLHFKETKKKLVCNVTNADSIAHLYGTEAKNWLGKRITLYPTRVPCGREQVDAIRIRETVPQPKQQQAALPPPPPVEETVPAGDPGDPLGLDL